MVARFQTLLSIVNFTWIDHFGSTLDFVPSGLPKQLLGEVRVLFASQNALLTPA
jgi:hypothetical protein